MHLMPMGRREVWIVKTKKAALFRFGAAFYFREYCV